MCLLLAGKHSFLNLCPLVVDSLAFSVLDRHQRDPREVARGEPGRPRGLGEGRGEGRLQPQAAQKQVHQRRVDRSDTG